MTTDAHRTLGRSGLTVSTSGLGCNNFGRPGTVTRTQEGTTAVIDAAIEHGVTLFDTADIYGGAGTSETLMGVALAGRRDRVVLATKFGHSASELGIAHPKGSRAYIREAIEGSLRRLQTDHVDLYQLHTPDPSTPIAETIAALDELVDEGKILAFGHSNFSAEQILEAEVVATQLDGRRFESAQNEYSLLARDVEAEVLPAVERVGIGFLPYFPLHNGLLTGKFRRDEIPADSRIARQKPQVAESAPWEVLATYEAFCTQRGVSMLEATFAWLLAQPSIPSVIAGATRPEQVAQNAAAATAWDATADDIAQISAIFAQNQTA